MKDMEFGSSQVRVEESKSDSEIKRQILVKLAKRKEFLEGDIMAGNFCAELNPDVIVISDDQSFLFEPQNSRMAEWLQQHFGIENVNPRDRFRVHPSQCRRIIKELKMAGFGVNGLFQS